MIAHYALAELTCYDALGWPPPDEVIDTLAEARVVRGQVAPTEGWGQLSIARWLGVPAMEVGHKEEMRALAMGKEIPADRRQELLDYCRSDVETLAGIWEKLAPRVDLELAAVRGRYLKALAKVENRGIPADRNLIVQLEDYWDEIKRTLVAEATARYGAAISDTGRFSRRGWQEWCERAGIHWPKLHTGIQALDEDTFKKMADLHPEVRTMAYTRKILGQTRAFEFPLGPDGRLRCMLSPFGSDTGRNQPSSSRYIFGASAWLRSVIQAPPGRVLAYIDFASQEFALAAALSNDGAMMDDYASGDPYLALARRAGAVPADATKTSHPKARAKYKVTALAVQYGMQAGSLARTHGMPVAEAGRLITRHQDAYPRFWLWRQAVADTVMCDGNISTRFGWTRRRKPGDKATSIANFPVQAAGAEILRIAVIALEEAGHRVVATVHDALLVEMDEPGGEEELAAIRLKLSKAARAVAPEVEIRTDVDITLSGEHFVDERGKELWEIVSPVIGKRIATSK